MGCEVIQFFFPFVFYYFIHLFILPDSKISLSQELMAEGPDIVKLISSPMSKLQFYLGLKRKKRQVFEV